MKPLNHCLNHYIEKRRNDTTSPSWLLFHDADEYMFPVNTTLTLSEALQAHVDTCCLSVGTHFDASVDGSSSNGVRYRELAGAGRGRGGGGYHASSALPTPIVSSERNIVSFRFPSCLGRLLTICVSVLG